MQDYFKKVTEAAALLRKRVSIQPKLILVLSGGLETFLDYVENQTKLLSSEIPHFPWARAEGHKGELIFGHFEKLPMVVLRGRVHFYEGLSPQEVVFPYFVLNELGATFLVSTNAVGGVRSDLNVGNILVVKDHINRMGTNPLIGITIQRPTDQFPSMQEAYDKKLRELALTVAKEKKIEVKMGVYLANSGPSYETPAEVKMCRNFGADTVGMSTVFETIAARFLKMRVLSFNIVTNLSADKHQGPLKHEEVLEAMKKTQGKVAALLKGVVGEIAKFA